MATMGRPLPRSYFQQEVVSLARDLLGKVLLRGATGGPIVETEAYHQDEPACHAYPGDTRRNRTMFLSGGHLYVYRIHQSVCCNVVCGLEGVGAAVLVRALLPTDGRAVIARRRRGKPERIWTDGPGKLCVALGITLEDDGVELTNGKVRLLDRGLSYPDDHVEVGPRVGIRQAKDLPWRFRVRPE